MTSRPPPMVPRKPSGVRVMVSPGEELPPGGLPGYTHPVKDNSANREADHSPLLNAEREVAILNHCFDDVERFMSRLQQTAEAQTVLNQRKQKKSKKSKKKVVEDDDLLTMKACPPTEDEFVDIFQKFKYSFCLLDRLKCAISQPDAPELLHHILMPLRLMVKTTGGPELGASVKSPALTSGAVSLLQDHLTEDERQLWNSLGKYWTSRRSDLGEPVPPYSPVFLDGWQPPARDSAGRPFEDPIESQHGRDAFGATRQTQNHRDENHQTDNKEDETNGLPPEGERLYCCSYDFVARNSSELSVLQGETLEVIDSSKRWWKCRNRFDQIGFVPSNILEPLSALSDAGRNGVVERSESKKVPLSPGTKYYSYTPTSPVATSPTATNPPTRPQSLALPATTMQGEDGDRVLIMNEELMQRLAQKKSSIQRQLSSRSSDTSLPLNYHSPPSDVEAWLTAKGFSQPTIQSLGILTGAQLFSLNKDELRTVSPDEGARVYSQMTVQKALLEDVRKSSELEKAMEKQKQKISLDS